jgi:non-specific serine/threonine protein kinase
VRVLVTSREVLGLGGEAIWRVPSLATPSDGPLGSNELLRFDAIQLFLERARLVQRGFALTDANVAAVAQVCRRLDGIPLAIELAAARIAVLSPEQINERLRDRFRLLTGGSRSSLRRQQTLRALVDWSHDLLSPSERTLLRRLAVFRGGWTLEAAEAIGGSLRQPQDEREAIALEEVLDLLAALVQKSLVVVEDESGRVRYHLLETIRQYAEEKLFEAGEAAAIRDRHRDWYLAFAHATQGEDEFETPAAMGQLARENDNLRAAAAWSGEADGAAPSGLQLVTDLYRFWSIRSYSEAGRWLMLFLDAWREPDLLRARALVKFEEWHRFGGGFALARASIEEARAIFLARGDRRGVAEASARIGIEAAMLGDYIAAHAAIEESIAVFRTLGDRPLIANRLRDLALVLACRRDFAGARTVLEESLEIARTLGGGQHSAVGMGLLRLGIVDRLEGDFARARDHLDQAVAMLEEVDTARGGRVFFARNALGSLALAEGRLEQARAILREQMASRDTAFPLEFWGGLCLFGILASANGDHARVARLIAAGSPAGPPASVHEPDIRIDAEDALARARAGLGEAAFEIACTHGRAMTVQQAVEYALDDTAN